MKYLMLIHHGPSLEEWKTLSEDEKGALYEAWKAINETPGVTPGLQLQPAEMATTVRFQDGKMLTTDGPFAETKEAIGGYFHFESDDPDAAVELAARVPSTLHGGAIEIRPIVEW